MGMHICRRIDPKLFCRRFEAKRLSGAPALLILGGTLLRATNRRTPSPFDRLIPKQPFPQKLKIVGCPPACDPKFSSSADSDRFGARNFCNLQTGLNGSNREQRLPTDARCEQPLRQLMAFILIEIKRKNELFPI